MSNADQSLAEIRSTLAVGSGMVDADIDLDSGDLTFRMAAATATLPGEPMLKVGFFGDHQAFCDEPPIIGGTDEAPQPLAYIALGVGWCVLTQLQRAAHLQGVDIANASARVEMDWWSKGKLADNTAETGCSGVRIHLAVTSGADRGVLDALIAQAERGCYAENLIKNPVPLSSTIEVSPG